uniref:EF-hand domain-containing protein n=1 Tax=viral metagenome TaxID=1070528 RepID=A0A6C0HGG5_9ZZZZ
MSDIDAVINKCVDDIWKEYGKKGSESLSKDDTKKFVMNTLSDMEDVEPFTEADFEACFKEFDLDGSGTIEKEEMVTFIKKMSGLV